MFILSSISSGLEFLSYFNILVNHTSIYGTSELIVFRNIKILDEISCNWRNSLLGKNVYKTLKFRW